VEVLSPSTEGYDRGEKFTQYRQIDSLQEYVLVSQEVARLEIFFRHPDGTWLFKVVSGLQSHASFASLSVQLSLAEVYSGVAFATKPEAI
jgi:Uma2 family endonuclease